jgi:cytochrome c
MRTLWAPALIAGSVLVAAMGLDTTVANAADGNGAQVFAQCAACHSTDGSNGVGPTLKGVVGRASASVPGFAYSSAMKRAHVSWTPEELDKYIASPQGTVPGNTMPFAGLSDAGQRTALIAYLSTLK